LQAKKFEQKSAQSNNKCSEQFTPITFGLKGKKETNIIKKKIFWKIP
jgi:hypothetical protein